MRVVSEGRGAVGLGHEARTDGLEIESALGEGRRIGVEDRAGGGVDARAVADDVGDPDVVDLLEIDRPGDISQQEIDQIFDAIDLQARFVGQIPEELRSGQTERLV